MTFKHVLGIGAQVATVGLAGSTAAWSRSGNAPEKSGQADTVLIGWDDNGNPAKLTSKHWADLPLLDPNCDKVIVASGCWLRMMPDELAAITVSGTFAGAPVQLRLDSNPEYAGRTLFHPGIATFRPGDRYQSFSFTFVHPNPTPQPCDGYRLQWRSPTGKEVRFTGGTLVAHYKAPPQPSTGKCA